jgi:catalase
MSGDRTDKDPGSRGSADTVRDVRGFATKFYTRQGNFDAVLVPGGDRCVQTLAGDGDAVHFVSEAFKHGKAIGALGDGVALLETARVTAVRGDGETVTDQGVVTAGAAGGDFTEAFVKAVAAHRHPERDMAAVPA